MSDLYTDTDQRYRNDPAFHAAVDTMEVIAREHGFTPGELKQIAFKAALNLEERRIGQVHRVLGDDRPCATCGGKVSPLLSYIDSTSRRYCGQDCYTRAR